MPFALRFHDPDPSDPMPEASGPGACAGSRLSILLTQGGWGTWDETNFSEQLPRVLGPIGVTCHRIGSAAEVGAFLARHPVHIAIVDISIPMDPARDLTPAGSRVLTLLRRLHQPPPTVIVRPPQASLRDSGRGLSDALREGAFSVLDGPVRLESMLEVLRRVVHRHYRDRWPAA